jgi:hypothetical protein
VTLQADLQQIEQNLRVRTTVDGKPTGALAALGRVREHAEKLEADYADARKVITEQHFKLWSVGLDTHEGEERQSEEDSVANLRALLAALDETP